MRASTLLLAVALTGLAAAAAADAPYSKPTGEDFARNVYWGDLHVHSNLSPDSYTMGNANLGPDSAYRFAKGERVASHVNMDLQLRRPLDFLMVSDHAEFLGVFVKLDNEDEALLGTTLGKRWNDYRQSDRSSEVMLEFVRFIQDPNYVQELSETFRRDTWRQAAEAADEHNEPGVFTAFVGYEWTSMVDGNNLHRVVVFRDDAETAGARAPFSSLDSQDPEDLWAWLAQYEEETGGKVMSIPHNGNLSNGLMFADKRLDGSDMDRAYAEARRRWEPLYEVTQVKGDGEAHPFLSPDDEFADYETWDADNIGRTEVKQPWMLAHEYARPALKLGLKWADTLGANPFEFGMIGSTDSHTTFATADDDNYFGKFADSEPQPSRMSTNMADRLWLNWKLAASGYAAVWARENTREALYDAMQRREVYTTTGPRITLRFFGGWSFEDQHADAPDLAAIGYEGGVPMGGILTETPENAKAPSFLISALRDPEGAYLDRIQVVKGWVNEDGEVAEKIYDVALSDERRRRRGGVKPVGNTVDVDTATYTNSIGAAELSTVWSDPEFDASQRAMYYVRVLEIPTPRWSTVDAVQFGVDIPEEAPRTHQERVYSSPIWYNP